MNDLPLHSQIFLGFVLLILGAFFGLFGYYVFKLLRDYIHMRRRWARMDNTVGSDE